MAAAIEAARAGLFCTLIDEAPCLGGQIYRQPPGDFHVKDACALGKDFLTGEHLRAEFDEIADRVEVLSGTSVLGVWGGHEMLWASRKASGTIHAEQLIIATGAYERPVPLPGWTLPGVMTAGGAQTLIKTMHVRPGRRAIVAGTGPLILGVANRLHEIGVEVVTVLEAGKPSWSFQALLQEWGEWGFVKDAWDYWQGLCRAGIPLRYNYTVFEVHGHDEVERASYGPVDPHDWQPCKDQAQTVEVDLVVIGFGFVPNTELTELAGCRHQFIHELGGWVPSRDAMMQTTVPGVFAVGDGAGVAGAHVAVEEGRVAGIAVAQQAGTITAHEAARRRATPLARLRALARVRKVFNAVSWIRPGLLALTTPATLVCRCEEVSLAEVRAALDQGACDLQAVKLLTRLGMGPCQGRNCAPSMGMYLCHATGRTPEQVGRINPRPPIRPVTFGALAQAEEIAEVATGDPLNAISRGGVL